MADQIINYYEFLDREPDWIGLRHGFIRNVSKHGTPYFRAQSRQEEEFLRFCRRGNLKIQRKTIVQYDPRSPGERLIYLTLKADGGACVASNETSFLDRATECPGGGRFGTCGRNAKQVGIIRVSPSSRQLVSRFGLLSTVYPTTPRIYLVSTLVADALRAAAATGCEIAPTTTIGVFQLRITSETVGPARIGQGSLGCRCPICGAAKLFFGTSERYFVPGDLQKVDFQICRTYVAENVGRFEIINGFPIISQRTLGLLMGLGIRGLSAYSTDPPISFAVVQVQTS